MLTDDAYASLHALNERLMGECERVIAEYELPAHTVGMGSKGCVVMSTEPVLEYRDYLTKIHHELTDLAWLFHMNRGVFMTPGQDEEWTLSVMHTEADLQRYIDAFETFAREVTAGVRSSDSATSSRWDELEVTAGRRTGEFLGEVEVMA